VHADYQIKFPRETTVTGSRVLWATPKREMFRLPLAIVADNKLPPVELVVTTNDVTFVQVHGAVAGPSVVNIQYGASGHYTMCGLLALLHIVRSQRQYINKIIQYNFSYFIYGRKIYMYLKSQLISKV